MTNPLTVDKLLYTPVEAAHALGISRSTIYVLMASGEVQSVRIGASRRIDAEALRQYVARLSGDGDGLPPARHRSQSPKQQRLWR